MSRLTTLGVRGTTAVVLAAALCGPVPRALAATGPSHNWHPPKVQRVKVLPRTPLKVTRHHWKLRHVPEGTRGHATWPAPGSAAASFGAAAARGHLERVGGLPVLAARASGPAGSGLAGAKVRVFGRSAVARLGLTGVVFTVSSDGGGGLAAIGVDYGRFADAVGGDFADRLRLVQLPACALTDPKAARCRVETPVDTDNSASRQLLSGAVWLGSAWPGRRDRPLPEAQGAVGRTHGRPGGGLRRVGHQRRLHGVLPVAARHLVRRRGIG